MREGVDDFARQGLRVTHGDQGSRVAESRESPCRRCHDGFAQREGVEDPHCPTLPLWTTSRTRRSPRSGHQLCLRTPGGGPGRLTRGRAISAVRDLELAFPRDRPVEIGPRLAGVRRGPDQSALILVVHERPPRSRPSSAPAARPSRARTSGGGPAPPPGGPRRGRCRRDDGNLGRGMPSAARHVSDGREIAMTPIDPRLRGFRRQSSRVWPQTGRVMP